MTGVVIRSMAPAIVLLTMLATAPGVGVSHAATIFLGTETPLQELLGWQDASLSPSITVGDKVFSAFTYNRTGKDMPTAADVNVIPIFIDGNYGLRFQGSFGDTQVGSEGSDAFLTFQVEVSDPRFLISDIHLSGNPNVLGDKSGSVSVTEEFAPLEGPPLGQAMLDIYDDFGTKKVSDEVRQLSRPVRGLLIMKDIWAFAAPSTATVSRIDQTFSQVEVPEPVTAVLLSIGVVAMMLGTRRGRSRHVWSAA